jgi:hypothetical protein
MYSNTDIESCSNDNIETVTKLLKTINTENNGKCYMITIEEIEEVY